MRSLSFSKKPTDGIMVKDALYKVSIISQKKINTPFFFLFR